MVERIGLQVSIDPAEITRTITGVNSIYDAARERSEKTGHVVEDLKAVVALAKAGTIVKFTSYLAGEISADELFDFIDPRGAHRQAMIIK